MRQRDLCGLVAGGWEREVFVEIHVDGVGGEGGGGH